MTLSDNMRGALLMVAAMTCFTLNDACLKSLSDGMSAMQAIFMRGIVTSTLLAIAAWKLGAFSVPVSRHDKGLIVLRCVAEAGAAWFFLTALFHMPLGDLTAILQALPLAVTLGSALVFKEPVGWRRMSAILAGFLGVLLIVRPGSDVFSIYSVYGVATVLCATVRDLATRRLSKEVHTMNVTFWTALIVTLFALVVGFGQEWVRPSAGQLGLIGLAALLVLAAYLTIIMAVRVGEIAFVAPFRYTGLVVAIIAGLVIFGDFPDALTWIGSAIVVGSGLFAFWRERRLAIPRRGIPRPNVPPR
ncbi:DMT family transporter [Pelagovum pacificum]|uniref:DMT family transporter n=1 Tax=Pelagovum pacificum TaxID=2588711 RepID=A0A5C5G9D3_9RHOB|nr:DMT family transporter [Pelagovum pacificum]QQA42274.1 DMT family transporter [Pelagovum pacificum]TNY31358.1 DMT family transporter [Pelagovum pacificum]